MELSWFVSQPTAAHEGKVKHKSPRRASLQIIGYARFLLNQQKKADFVPESLALGGSQVIFVIVIIVFVIIITIISPR